MKETDAGPLSYRACTLATWAWIYVSFSFHSQTLLSNKQHRKNQKKKREKKEKTFSLFFFFFLFMYFTRNSKPKRSLPLFAVTLINLIVYSPTSFQQSKGEEKRGNLFFSPFLSLFFQISSSFPFPAEIFENKWETSPLSLAGLSR